MNTHNKELLARFAAVVGVCLFVGVGDACEERHAPADAGVAQQAAVRANPSPNVELSAQDVARAVFPSVVLLIMEDRSGQPLSLGSGFFVGPNLVATNYHVIAGAAGGTAKAIGLAQKVQLTGTVAVDAVHDLAIVALQSGQGRALETARGDSVEVGQAVFAVGNPRGLEGTFSSGIVSSLRSVGSDTVLQITAPISPGSSGGPVVDSRGHVVGVATATFTGGQNLNFAVPSKYVDALKTQVAPAKPFPGLSAATENASFLRTIGGSRATKGVVGDEFVWSNAIRFHVASEFQHGGFTLTLRNQLREAVKNVNALVIFYNRKGEPLEVAEVSSDFIPPGLARRVEGKVDPSVQEITTEDGTMRPFTRVEVRVLDFQIAQ